MHELWVSIREPKPICWEGNRILSLNLIYGFSALPPTATTFCITAWRKTYFVLSYADLTVLVVVEVCKWCRCNPSINTLELGRFPCNKFLISRCFLIWLKPQQIRVDWPPVWQPQQVMQSAPSLHNHPALFPSQEEARLGTQLVQLPQAPSPWNQSVVQSAWNSDLLPDLDRKSVV